MTHRPLPMLLDSLEPPKESNMKYQKEHVIRSLLRAIGHANADAPIEAVIGRIQVTMTHLGLDDLNAYEGQEKPAARAWAWKRPNNDSP